jgi:hypothetical protein
MALTQISTQGIKDGTITGSDLATNVDLVDDQKLRLGTGNDLQIYHDGSESLISNANSGVNLVLKSAASAVIKHDTETMAQFIGDGAVELYHDNSKKFETLTNGVHITGTTFLDDSSRDDGFKAKFGTGDDLQIYHDGSNSYIDDTATGNLVIRSNQINFDKYTGEALARFRADGNCELFHNNVSKFETTSSGAKITGALEGDSDLLLRPAAGNNNVIMQPNSGAETLLKATVNGNVELYYDNSKKFETTSSGVEVFGELQMDDANSHIKLPDNARIDVGNSNDLRIYHVAGANSYVQNFANNLYLSSTNSVQIVTTASDSSAQEISAKFFRNGAVELYYDNTKMLSTESRGAILQKADACTFIIGSTNAGSAQLFLDGDSNGDGNGGDYSGIRHNSAGHLEVFADNPSTNASIYFKTGNAANRALIDGDGHFYPYDNNTYDLGTSSYRWRNIYTNDLNLSNEGSSNDVDGTWGSYTIQEGAEDLFLVNKRNGKKYKFNLTEVS